MQRRTLNKNSLGTDEDFHGNNVAATCPHCSKVFLSSGYKDTKGRACPSCGKSLLYCAKNGSEAWIEW